MQSISFPEAKIKVGFTGYTGVSLYASGSVVSTSLTGNIDFPLTQPLLANLIDANTAFNVALDNAESLDKISVQIKRARRAELIVQLKLVAASVIYEANGDRQKLLGTGFQLQKQKAPALLVNPSSTEVTDGNAPGELKFTVKGGRNFRGITFQSAPDPMTEGSIWTSVTGTTRKHTFEGLTSQKKFWLRVQILGSNNQLYISNPISRVAQ